MPVVWLMRLCQVDRVSRELLERVYVEKSAQQLRRAAATLRELVARLEAEVEPSPSQQAARQYLLRWSIRLEDLHTTRELRKAVLHGDLCGQVAVQTPVAPILGVRNPDAVVRGSRYVPR